MASHKQFLKKCNLNLYTLKFVIWWIYTKCAKNGKALSWKPQILSDKISIGGDESMQYEGTFWSVGMIQFDKHQMEIRSICPVYIRPNFNNDGSYNIFTSLDYTESQIIIIFLHNQIAQLGQSQLSLAIWNFTCPH